ncbi:hypothetical protein C0Q70_02666 [Pomacea canaliculata]|uniref:Uncharacterized protein n=1 Tax=Pomacea canaliculata TaxID=400727 RepID=A0A2T7PQK1_POMCA|nr:hypothetical protein C0Q70_02666 [Pomacea canaliculata]
MLLYNSYFFSQVATDEIRCYGTHVASPRPQYTSLRALKRRLKTDLTWRCGAARAAQSGEEATKAELAVYVASSLCIHAQ